MWLKTTLRCKVKSKLVKTNNYRCLEHCHNCPFLDNGKAMLLNDGRVDDIKESLLNGDSFSCHKTVHDLDLEMNPTEPQEEKMCHGAYTFLKNAEMPNQIMRIASK